MRGDPATFRCTLRKGTRKGCGRIAVQMTLLMVPGDLLNGRPSRRSLTFVFFIFAGPGGERWHYAGIEFFVKPLDRTYLIGPYNQSKKELVS